MSLDGADPGWSVDGFEPGPEGLTQDLLINGRTVQRRYTVDTLFPHFPFTIAAPVTETGRQWLAQEAGPLLAQSRNCW